MFSCWTLFTEVVIRSEKCHQRLVAADFVLKIEVFVQTVEIFVQALAGGGLELIDLRIDLLCERNDFVRDEPEHCQHCEQHHKEDTKQYFYSSQLPLNFSQ